MRLSERKGKVVKKKRSKTSTRVVLNRFILCELPLS